MEARCNEVAEARVAQGSKAVALHGGRSQNEREAGLHDFRSSSTDILKNPVRALRMTTRNEHI
ncbi:hypothetical protein Tsubulata_044495 [Turnera subulata]|uniref:Uncharacterized protein n=1 Tax=Turnera subulata TaxID=218843 RepID=A0A9Q0G7R6_9ROSI|nr:hypothetical protein Tsubulata_044495 [Turnera subulata]